MKIRFTIRDLLWLVVVVALAVGWSLDRRHLNNRLAWWVDQPTQRFRPWSWKSRSDSKPELIIDNETGELWMRKPEN